ncbi:MAG: hypothetical protein K8T91_04755 [Planctomycetes bacterium]|nr:hypothetical protein [Planctomycetota bacterium]
MKTQQFLEYHGIAVNPFAEEDAQTDPVFKQHCLRGTHHPTWDKIYGDPSEPATSLVFGEKGSGKTAMRLQILEQLRRHNEERPDSKVFVIDYDDFNPFLDRFRDTLSSRRRRADRVLAEWKVWDHMDGILSLGVTSLVDRILELKQPSGAAGPVPSGEVKKLDRHQSRDLLLLAACYDTSTAETFAWRWRRLRRRLRFRTWRSQWDLALGIAATVAVLGLTIFLKKWEWFSPPYLYLMIVILLAAWAPRLWRLWRWFWVARGIVRNVRIGNRETNPLRRALMQFTGPEISSQPLPNKQRTDDRFEMLRKLQGILKTLGFHGVIVLVDRVDEPHLINGSADQMRAFLWPMLDNKLLKHPGLGFKLLLPIELGQFIEREDRDFYERARLDKQNMIPSLEWTGEALYDVATSRVQACAQPGSAPKLTDLFDDSVTQRRLIDAFRTLRVPRHLFKFLYRLFVAHCNAHTDQDPSWTISSELFESVLAVYIREQDAVDRGMRAS